MHQQQKCVIKDPEDLIKFWDGRTRKYTIDQVEEILEKVQQNGLNPTVKEYRISKNTVRTWLRKEKNAIGVLKAYYKRVGR